MSLESGLAFFAAILLFAVTPGPGVFAVLARALISGARSCFFLSLRHLNVKASFLACHIISTGSLPRPCGNAYQHCAH